MKLGLYEKALPLSLSWEDKFKYAKELGFDYLEMSIDESDERLNRLNYSKDERFHIIELMYQYEIKIHSLCLSGHRRYPLGSEDPNVRVKASSILHEAIDLASDLGISIIQLAGYDVYYDAKSELTREYFIEGLQIGIAYASQKGVVLAIEIMDDPFINSITKYMEIKASIASPYLAVYPDVGNLSAWNRSTVIEELSLGLNEIVAIHLKDTLPVTETSHGVFKNIDFGKGCVDFENVLSHLYSIGYNGLFLLEMWSNDSEVELKRISEAKKFIDDVLRSAGYEQ